MARYRLLTPHVTHESQLLEAGMEVGTGTHYSWAYPDGSPRPPTPEMEPLDDQAKFFKESFTRGSWPPVHPEKLAEAPKKPPPPEEPEEDDEPDRAFQPRAKHHFEPTKRGR